MTGTGTTRRTIRIDDAVWDRAKALASRRGESVSDVVRAGLLTYITNADDHGFEARPLADASTARNR